MPSEFALKSMNQIHRALMKVSGGRLGWSAGKMPVLELTTTGRKSGQPRTSMLTSPYQDGETMAIVASAGGNDQNPAWFLNLRDDPAVKVRTEAGTVDMTARITSGEERADLWENITAAHKNYAGYQTKTEREIPVVMIEPVDG
jgi:deazaflavin-dependent oxidoreductase (nitroreductase family)